MVLWSTVATVFNEIEQLSSRLAITQKLGELFKALTPDEAKIVANLALGVLHPAYLGTQFNLAEKALVIVLARLAQLTPAEVLAQQQLLGDWGLVAEQLIAALPLNTKDVDRIPATFLDFTSLHSERAGNNNPLTITALYTQLCALEAITGTGASEQKITALVELLQQCDGVSAKLIVRIILGKLRLGFSDMTLIDSLSYMLVGDKSVRGEIEHAYNLVADIGQVAYVAKAAGLAGLQQLQVTLGIPIRPAAAERLNSPTDIIQRLGCCAAQPKLDGFRVQIHVDHSSAAVVQPSSPATSATVVAGPERLAALRENQLDSANILHSAGVVKFFSRNLLDMSAMFPDLVPALQALPVTSLICEGEALVYDEATGSYLPFQETVRRRRKYDIAEMAQEFPLRLVLFDILYLNGQELLSKTHVERRQILQELLFTGVGHRDLLKSEHIALSRSSRAEQSEVEGCCEPEIQSSAKLELAAQKLVLVDELRTCDAQELETYFLQNISAGLEGLVVKKLDATYQPGKRNFNWIKLKRHETGHLDDTLDCVILGYYYGQGKRAKFGIGAFLVGIFNPARDLLQTVAKVGTGLSDQEWVELRRRCDQLRVPQPPSNVDCDKNLAPDVWVTPEIVCQIRADEITKSPAHRAGQSGAGQIGYALRFPRFMGYRTDKSLTEITTTDELVEIYNLQYR